MQRLLLIALLFIYNCSWSQLFTPTTYPAGYFRNPLGIPIQLSANFGELRPNHFHMGFDIRTAQRENLPVYAAADGFISEVSIERYGFGRGIYIQHPNGYTTVYAHLNDFYPQLQQYVVNKQYADESWEQDIYFEPGQFPVVKGQLIGYSGNTGGSAGPHLHFEVRDTRTGNNLNPWLFNFNLADNIAPYIFHLYLYDRRYSTYQAGPTAIPIKKTAGGYTTTNSIVTIPTPAFSLGISAEDKSNTSNFLFGIYQAELYVDDTARFAFQLNNFSYKESRLVNAAIDYKTKAKGGPYIQHLSRLPGNHGSIFSNAAADGVIIVDDTLVHTARIKVLDVAGNSSVLSFRFRYQPQQQKELSFAQNFFSFLPNQENKLAMQDIQVLFPSSSFYHMVPFVYSVKQATDSLMSSAVHELHNNSVPVNDSFTVRIKAPVSFSPTLRNNVVMQLFNNRKKVAVKGSWDGDWMQAKFWDLGSVRLIVDTVPPVVRLSGWVNRSNVKARKSISLLVTDDAGEIKTFRAELDGKWLMFSRKNDLFIHTFDERTTTGRHNLRVVVQDEAGNMTEKNFTFIR